jgi:hypothetical protein
MSLAKRTKGTISTAEMVFHLRISVMIYENCAGYKKGKSNSFGYSFTGDLELSAPVTVGNRFDALYGRFQVYFHLGDYIKALADCE